MKKLLLPIFVVTFFIILAPVLVSLAAKGGKETPAASNGLNKGKSETHHLYLYEKDPVTWEIVEGGAWGKMTYDSDSFVFNGHGLVAGTEYTLIYYPDPWPGNGLECLGSSNSDNDGNVHIKEDYDITSIPKDYDDNYEDGAKIWLVLSSDVTCNNTTMMIGWNPTEYLFEYDLINKTDETTSLDTCTSIQDGTLLTSDRDVIETGYDDWGYNYQAHMFNGMYCDAYRDAAWCQPYKDVKLMMKWNDAWLSNKDCDGDGLLDRHYGYPSYIGSGAWLTNHQSGEYEIVEWDLVGNWKITVHYQGRDYIHYMAITEQDEEGNLIGTGSCPSHHKTWELIESSIQGNEVTLNLDYIGENYIATLDGEILDDRSMAGSWTSNTGQTGGTWETSDGSANENIETCKWNYFVKIVAVPADAYSRDGIWYSADGTEIGPEIWGEFAIIQQVENDPCAGIHGAQYISPAGPGFGKYKP